MALITIEDTVTLANDTPPPIDSKIVIGWPLFQTADDRTIPGGLLTVPIGADGSFSVELEPSETAAPDFYYEVSYSLKGLARTVDYWRVPESAGPLKIADVSIPRSDLPIAGALKLLFKGDLPTFDGTNNQRLGVGANGTTLTADSTAPLGLRWTVPTAATPARLGNAVCALGDSLWGLFSTDTQWGNTLYYALLHYSRGRMKFVHNGGVSGENTEHILLRLTADALNQPCKWVLVDGGWNDIQQGIPISTIKANLSQIFSAILANGQVPIIVTGPPIASLAGQCATLVHWMRGQAAQLKVPIFDFFKYMVDPATNTYWPGYTSDTLHPAFAGLRVAGLAGAADLASYFPQEDTVLLPVSSGDTNNLIPNGLFLQGSTAGVGDGWFSANPSGHVTYTIEADTNFLGKVQVATKATGAPTDADSIDTQPISTGFAPGDKMAFCGRILTTGMEAGAHFVKMQLFGFTTGFSEVTLFLRPLDNWASDFPVPGGQWYMEFTVPANTAFLQAELVYGTGTGVVKIGQVGLYNLTQMGLA